MTTYTHLLFHDRARARLLAGTAALADAVRPTLGPQSRSVIIARKWGQPTVCDDGVTIARALTLRDPDENLGAQLLKDAAIRTGEVVGDGTTTSTLLAHALFADAMRNVTAGASAVALRRGMRRGAEVAVAALSNLSRPVTNGGELAHVATVSAHDDREIGDLVAAAIGKVGPTGVITVEEAKGIETSLEVVEGMQFDKGYLSPYFVTDPERMEAVLVDPLILVHEKKIASLGDLVPLLEDLVKQGRSLFVVAETVEGEALATLVVNRLRGTFQAVAVKAPGFGDRRRAILQDLAVLTGAELISDDLGMKLENVRAEHLGTAARVVIDKDSTTIVGGGGDPAAVEGRCEQLRSEIEDSTSDWDREKLQERLARLSGGVAVIRAGAATEGELRQRKEAFDDAISATRAAAEEGVVPGGGTALIRAMDAVEAEADRCSGDERTGVLVLCRALQVPARQIAENSGADGGVIVDRVRSGAEGLGFDARSGETSDMFQVGIIDPTKVVRVALEHAVSVATTLLLAEATMTEIDDSPDEATTHEPLE